MIPRKGNLYCKMRKRYKNVHLKQWVHVKWGSWDTNDESLRIYSLGCRELLSLCILGADQPSMRRWSARQKIGKGRKLLWHRVRMNGGSPCQQSWWHKEPPLATYRISAYTDLVKKSSPGTLPSVYMWQWVCTCKHCQLSKMLPFIVEVLFWEEWETFAWKQFWLLAQLASLYYSQLLTIQFVGRFQRWQNYVSITKIWLFTIYIYNYSKTIMHIL